MIPYFSENLSEHFLKSLGTFFEISRNFFLNLSELFLKSLGTFFEISRNFFLNLSELFLKSLGTFVRRIFLQISQILWKSSRNTKNILRLLQTSTVSRSCLQDCSDVAERMKRKALRVRSEGSIPPYVTEVKSRKQHSDSPLCNSLILIVC